jgi:hypothetical protein
MCRQFIKLIVTGFLFLQTLSAVFAQKISFSPAFEANPSTSNLLILGRHNDRLYVLANSIGKPSQLMIYDADLQLISISEKPALKRSIALAFINGTNGAELLFENSTDGNRVYHYMQLDGDEQREILSLPQEYANDWEFAASPGNNYFIFHKLTEIKKDSVKMNIIIMNSAYEVVDGKRFSFYVEGAFERLGNLFVDDAGGIYFMVHDQPLNYKLGTRLKLYKYASAAGAMIKKEFYIKEKKPVDIVLSFHPDNKLVYLHSFYSSFYTQDISGILSGAVNEKLEPVIPFSYFEFDKKFKRDLNTYSSGISSSDLMNYLRISNASVSDSGTACVTATLETAFFNPVLSYSPDRLSKQQSKIMDTDPLLAIGQREYLIRREMGMSSLIRGRRFSGGGSPPTSGYFEAYANVMSQRPDLFFQGQDSSLQKRNTGMTVVKSKVPDRQLVFAFDKNASVKWHRSFVLESQDQGKNAALPPAETDNSIVSLHYRLNKKEKTELGFTCITKPDGSLHDLPLALPENISLLTHLPVCKLSSNSVAVFYFDKILNKAGLAKVEW